MQYSQYSNNFWLKLNKMSIEKQVAKKLMTSVASLNAVTLIAGQDQERFANTFIILRRKFITKYFSLHDL